MKLSCGCEEIRGHMRLEFDLECELEYEVDYHCGSPKHDEGFGGLSKEVILRKLWVDGEEVAIDKLCEWLETYVREMELS